MMNLNLNTSFFEDVLQLYSCNDLKPSAKEVNAAIEALKNTNDVFGTIDQLIEDFINRKIESKHSNGRNYERERIKRLMRLYNLTEDQAIERLFQKRDDKKQKELKEQLKETLLLPKSFTTENPATKYVITTIEGVFEFKTKKEAFFFLFEKFEYKDTNSARISLVRNLETARINNVGFKAYEIQNQKPLFK